MLVGSIGQNHFQSLISVRYMANISTGAITAKTYSDAIRIKSTSINNDSDIDFEVQRSSQTTNHADQKVIVEACCHDNSKNVIVASKKGQKRKISISSKPKLGKGESKKESIVKKR